MLGVLLGVLVLAAVVAWRTDIGRAALLDVWNRASLTALIGTVLLMSLSFPAVAMRWRALLPAEQRDQINPLLLTGIVCVAQVFNYAVPGPVGELISVLMVRRRYGVPFGDGMAALALSRVIGVSSVLAIAGVLSLVYPFPIPEEYLAYLRYASWFALGGAFTLAFTALRPAWPRAVFERLTRSLEDSKLGGKLRRGVLNLLDGFLRTASLGWGAYLRSLGWAFVAHIVVSAGIALAVWSIRGELPLAGVLFTYAVSTASILVLFLFPGAQFGWDAIFAGTLTMSCAIPTFDATAVVVMVRVQHTFILLIGLGSLYWLVRGLLPQTEEIEAARRNEVES